MKIMHVVSVSGGKDSTATLLLALNRIPRENLRAIFCDTGNEHDLVYEHLDYLERSLGIKIDRLKADFSEEIANKRKFIARDARCGRKYATEGVVDGEGFPIWARDGCGHLHFKIVKKDGRCCMFVQKTKKVGGGRKIRWTNKAKRRALEVLHPTGNPFLDLCLWKGRFPSRKAQFCTEELKRDLAVGYQMDLLDAGYNVISWQGIRRDESTARKDAKKMERIGLRIYIFRPIVEWNALDVFAYAKRQGLEPNPLYLQGCGRVGCMPCINATKDEIRQIDIRWHDHINRISEWEELVGKASKRGASTFFAAIGETHTAVERGNITKVVEWSKTSRGGRQSNFIFDLEDKISCSSSYGLCE